MVYSTINDRSSELTGPLLKGHRCPKRVAPWASASVGTSPRCAGNARRYVTTVCGCALWWCGDLSSVHALVVSIELTHLSMVNAETVRILGIGSV